MPRYKVKFPVTLTVEVDVYTNPGADLDDVLDMAEHALNAAIDEIPYDAQGDRGVYIRDRSLGITHAVIRDIQDAP